jgi:hypothetical protein
MVARPVVLSHPACVPAFNDQHREGDVRWNDTMGWLTAPLSQTGSSYSADWLKWLRRTDISLRPCGDDVRTASLGMNAWRSALQACLQRRPVGMGSGVADMR